VNIVIVGLNEKQQGLFQLFNNPDLHEVTSFENGKLAIDRIKENRRAIDWIIVSDFSESSCNKELLCAIRSMNINPEVLVVNDSFEVKATRPALCSVQQTDTGPKLLTCAMHTMLSQDRSNKPEPKESTKANPMSMMVFNYQGKKTIKH